MVKLSKYASLIVFVAYFISALIDLKKFPHFWVSIPNTLSATYLAEAHSNIEYFLVTITLTIFSLHRHICTLCFGCKILFKQIKR